MRFLAALLVVCATIEGLATSDAVAQDASSKQVVACDQPAFLFAPYVWKRTGSGQSARAEATMPGAYFRSTVAGTQRIELIINGTVNQGCPASSMPTIEYSIDEGEFQIVSLSRSDAVYTLPLADGLDLETPHRIEVYFRAADLTTERWHATKTHFCVVGLQLDAGAKLLTCPQRPRLAIGFGDSITEGVGVDGLFTSWQQLDVNNARTTWFPLVAAALDCEYGQLGSGGQGLVLTHELPPLGDTWDRYDPTTSRLTCGRLVPEPNYIFCAMGTNDPGQDIHDNYVTFLTAVRQACPNAQFFCVVPPLGVHDSEVAAAVATRQQAGDARVHLIDLVDLRSMFRVNQGATQLAFDGVHPTVFGQAILGAMITVETQQALGATIKRDEPK